MTELRRQLDDLAGRGPHRDPDEVISSAMRAARAAPPDASDSATLELRMDTDPSSTPDRPRLRPALVALLGAAAAVLIAAGALVVALRSEDADTVETADTPATDPSATVTPTSEPTPTTGAPTTAAPTTEVITSEPVDDVPPIDLGIWVGTYEWAEAVEGIGSNQVLVHVLTLDAVTSGGTAITGQLRQNGFQTATDLRVRAIPTGGGTGIAIELVEVDRGKGIEVPGDVLFELSGDPARPLTTLRELLTLVVDQPEAGTYFLPVPADDAGDAETSRPAAFWAIEDGTFDLVRVDTATGDVLRRVAGWGPLSPEEDELGGQALVGVDAGPGEVVWVSDCCEPAIGGLFGIGPDTAGIDDPAASAFGVWPQISPDGRLVAMGILEQGVQIGDARTGEVVISPEEIGGILGRPEAGRGFPIPLAWVNDGLLAVAVSDPLTDRSTITFVDLRFIADPPVAVGQATIGGDVRDGSVRADGNLAVLVRSTGDDPGADIMVIDPVEVTVVERTPLQDGVVAIDFDPAGAHLLVLSETGQLSVAGPSGSVEPLTGSYLDVSW